MLEVCDTTENVVSAAPWATPMRQPAPEAEVGSAPGTLSMIVIELSVLL